MKRSMHKAVLCVYVLGSSLIAAQEALVISDFICCPGFYPPPNQTQPQSLLKGGQAKPLPGNRHLLSGGVELWAYLKTGETNLEVQTPDCVYDQARNTVSSSARIKLQTARGKFSIEGVGFLWRQTNSSLFISNSVRAVVQADMLGSASTNQTVESFKDTPAETVEIFSKRFQYSADSGLGVFSEEVRVSGTNLALTSGVLEVNVPYQERRVRQITARRKVEIDYGGVGDLGKVHAAGGQAIYYTSIGLMEITQDPTWRAGQREGRGDTLFIDQTNKVFRSEGHAWLRMPGQSARESGFFGNIQERRAGGNSVTNDFIEVRSDRYEVRTNSAHFERQTQLDHLVDGLLEGKMTCGTLDLTFSGTNQLQTITAEDKVVIEQFDKQDPKLFTGGRLHFDAPSGILTLTNRPAWRVGQRQGSGDIMEANERQDELVVHGHAWMRLPAGELENFGARSCAVQSRRLQLKNQPVRRCLLRRIQDYAFDCLVQRGRAD